MGKRRNLSIRGTLWLSIGLALMSTVLGAGALYRYRLHKDHQLAERLRVAGIAEAYAAQVSDLLLTRPVLEVRTFVEELSWHPATSLVAVLAPDGASVAVRGNEPVLQDYLRVAGSGSAPESTRAWNIDGDSSHMLPALALASAPIVAPDNGEILGTLVLAVRVTRDTGVSSGEVGQFVVNLMLIAAAGMILGLFWLTQKVLKPLAELARRPYELQSGRGISELFMDREDEIGRLAHVMAQMRRDINQWRGKASHLERSVDERIAEQTRRITKDLNRAMKKVWADPLTGLGNRRLFDEKFTEIFDAQCEAGQDLSIVVIDVDHFKVLNDTLGHKAGDELLVFVGELLKQSLREQDLAIRYGGDEFVLILPAVESRAAYTIAERIIRLFAQRAKLLQVRPSPTMSAGVASLHTHHTENPAILFEHADQALYEAKAAGKSCVMVSEHRCRLTSV